MLHKCKVTVLDKKLFPEYQQSYCAIPDSGKCPCYQVGDEFIFERYGDRDDYWHCGAGTLARAGETPADQPKEMPGGFGGIPHAGSVGVPHCSEAWDAISRYIYTALQGGSIMHGWMRDDRVMIACCNDGTRPVIFKLERLDYRAVYLREDLSAANHLAIQNALVALPEVDKVAFKPDFVEVYLKREIAEEAMGQALAAIGCKIARID